MLITRADSTKKVQDLLSKTAGKNHIKGVGTRKAAQNMVNSGVPGRYQVFQGFSRVFSNCVAVLSH